MDRPEILPPIGLPVVTNIVDLQAAEQASIGEIIHAAATLSKLASERKADPATFYELATFIQSGGADWSGLQGQKQATDETEDNCNDAVVPPPTPTPPENYCDTLPRYRNNVYPAHSKARRHDGELRRHGGIGNA